MERRQKREGVLGEGQDIEEIYNGKGEREGGGVKSRSRPNDVIHRVDADY